MRTWVRGKEAVMSATRPKGEGWKPLVNTKRVYARGEYIPYCGKSEWAVCANKELYTLSRQKYERLTVRAKRGNPANPVAPIVAKLPTTKINAIIETLEAFMSEWNDDALALRRFADVNARYAFTNHKRLLKAIDYLKRMKASR